MKRSKILLITGAYPSEEEPIANIFVREHARAAQIYDDIAVLHWVAGHKSQLNKTIDHDILVYRLEYQKSKIPKISYFIYLWRVFQAFRQIKARGFKPDIVHANSSTSGVAAIIIGFFYRIPVIITEHCSEFPRKLLSRFQIFEAKFAFKFAKLVCPVSIALKKAIKDYGIKANFCVVPNVVDKSIFYPGPKIINKNNIKSILFIGSLVPVKGLPYLFKALKIINKQRSDWYLSIIGSGSHKEEYVKMVAGLGIKNKIRFHGVKSKKQVAEYMRNCNFLIQPSLYETFGVVHIEAMACGKPVIATNIGGPKEFINKKNGMLVSPKNIDELSRAISYMLDNYQKFSTQNIAQYAINNFSHEVVGKKISKIYQKLCQE